jgi:hypothetical protein
MLADIFHEALQKMDGALIAVPNERIVAFNSLHLEFVVGKDGNIRVVLPKFWRGSKNACSKFPWVTGMKVAKSGRQHEDIAGRLEIGEDYLSWGTRQHRNTGLLQQSVPNYKKNSGPSVTIGRRKL